MGEINMKKLTDNDYFIQNDYIDKILENPDDYDYLDLIKIYF